MLELLGKQHGDLLRKKVLKPRHGSRGLKSDATYLGATYFGCDLFWVGLFVFQVRPILGTTYSGCDLFWTSCVGTSGLFVLQCIRERAPGSTRRSFGRFFGRFFAWPYNEAGLAQRGSSNAWRMYERCHGTRNGLLVCVGKRLFFGNVGMLRTG